VKETLFTAASFGPWRQGRRLRASIPRGRQRGKAPTGGGSVLEVGQTWQTQYNSGIFFNGRFQTTPVVYFTGESRLKQAH
jgi:hypothetical protein